MFKLWWRRPPVYNFSIFISNVMLLLFLSVFCFGFGFVVVVVFSVQVPGETRLGEEIPTSTEKGRSRERTDIQTVVNPLEGECHGGTNAVPE